MGRAGKADCGREMQTREEESFKGKGEQLQRKGRNENEGEATYAGRKPWEGEQVPAWAGEKVNWREKSIVEGMCGCPSPFPHTRLPSPFFTPLTTLPYSTLFPCLNYGSGWRGGCCGCVFCAH